MLFLFETEVTDAGWRISRGLTQLRELNLSRHQSHRCGIGAAQGPHATHLLPDLEGTQVTGAGMKGLQDAFPNCLLFPLRWRRKRTWSKQRRLWKSRCPSGAGRSLARSGPTCIGFLIPALSLEIAAPAEYNCLVTRFRIAMTESILKQRGRYFELPLIGQCIRRICFSGFLQLEFDDPNGIMLTFWLPFSFRRFAYTMTLDPRNGQTLSKLTDLRRIKGKLARENHLSGPAAQQRGDHRVRINNQRLRHGRARLRPYEPPQSPPRCRPRVQARCGHRIRGSRPTVGRIAFPTFPRQFIPHRLHDKIIRRGCRRNNLLDLFKKRLRNVHMRHDAPFD